MKKIIVPTGYMGSGSSAVTDFVSEFSNVSNKTNDFEFVFLHCPNGVFDLEDKLLHGNNAIRSDEAIHSFLNAMKDLYDKKFWWPGNYKKVIGKDFYNEVKSYINNLVDVNTNSYWYYQENPTLLMQIHIIITTILKKFSFNKLSFKKSLLYNEMLLSYKTADDFYRYSKVFINNFIKMIDSSEKDIILDQLLLPYNLFRISNYFDDNLRVIVVERDPRDVFVLNKYSWTKKKIDVPYSLNVKEFCLQYKKIREMEIKITSNKILRIKFEDLIYNYDEVKIKIMNFLNYNENQHIHKFERFNPNISINNTQVFRKIDNQEEIEYIEKELKNFLYDFPIEIDTNINNVIN